MGRMFSFENSLSCAAFCFPKELIFPLLEAVKSWTNRAPSHHICFSGSCLTLAVNSAFGFQGQSA